MSTVLLRCTKTHSIACCLHRRSSKASFSLPPTRSWPAIAAPSARSSSPAPLINQARHQPRPPRLVAGAEAFARIPVEVLVEQHQILPVRVVREELRLAGAAGAVGRAVAVGVGEEDADH